MKIHLTDLRAAAGRKRAALAAEAQLLAQRHERELAAAIASKEAVSSASAKQRHAVGLRLAAADGILSALDEIEAETALSSPGAST